MPQLGQDQQVERIAEQDLVQRIGTVGGHKPPRDQIETAQHRAEHRHRRHADQAPQGKAGPAHLRSRRLGSSHQSRLIGFGQDEAAEHEEEIDRKVAIREKLRAARAGADVKQANGQRGDSAHFVKQGITPAVARLPPCDMHALCPRNRRLQRQRNACPSPRRESAVHRKRQAMRNRD